MQKIKKGDQVIVLTGNDKGREGKVERVMIKTSQVLVSGVRIVKRHVKRTAQFEGGIVEITKPIHISNVSLIDPKSKKPTRAGFKAEGDKLVRIAKKSGEEIK